METLWRNAWTTVLAISAALASVSTWTPIRYSAYRILDQTISRQKTSSVRREPPVISYSWDARRMEVSKPSCKTD